MERGGGEQSLTLPGRGSALFLPPLTNSEPVATMGMTTKPEGC